MLRFPLDPASPDPVLLERAAAAIGEGLIVAFPTDTLYGLAVDPRNAAAVGHLFEAKGRPKAMPLPLIAADLDQVRQAGTLTTLGAALANAFWPGPLTLVIEAAAAIVPGVHGRTGRVGVRVPNRLVARELARQVGYPITATSANRTGEPAPADAGGVARVPGLADLLLDAGPTAGGPPSTIVDVTGSAPLLVRAGAVPWARVLESL